MLPCTTGHLFRYSTTRRLQRVLSSLPLGIIPRYVIANLSREHGRKMAFIFHMAQRPDNLKSLLRRQSVKHIGQLLPRAGPVPMMLVTHLGYLHPYLSPKSGELVFMLR